MAETGQNRSSPARRTVGRLALVTAVCRSPGAVSGGRGPFTKSKSAGATVFAQLLPASSARKTADRFN